jgi:hypothetical protein
MEITGERLAKRVKFTLTKRVRNGTDVVVLLRLVTSWQGLGDIWGPYTTCVPCPSQCILCLRRGMGQERLLLFGEYFESDVEPRPCQLVAPAASLFDRVGGPESEAEHLDGIWRVEEHGLRCGMVGWSSEGRWMVCRQGDRVCRGREYRTTRATQPAGGKRLALTRPHFWEGFAVVTHY